MRVCWLPAEMGCDMLPLMSTVSIVRRWTTVELVIF